MVFNPATRACAHWTYSLFYFIFYVRVREASRFYNIVCLGYMGCDTVLFVLLHDSTKHRWSSRFWEGVCGGGRIYLTVVNLRAMVCVGENEKRGGESNRRYQT